MSAETKPDPAARMPPQIPYIIGNEGCERFSFYGMRNILTPFLITYLFVSAYPDKGLRADMAKEVFHTFVMGVYFFPLLGGWVADRFFGKYNTILWFSLVYCVGQFCLALFTDNKTGFYIGLGLISFGSGGIKPLVASFMGDQFDSKTKHLAKLVFDAFYWIINFGSFFASLTMPIFLRELGPRWAFGIPGVLMLIATIVFWLGRKQYVLVPLRPHDPNSFMRVVRTALFTPGPRATGLLIAGAGAALAAACIALGIAREFGAISWLRFVPSAALGVVLIVAFGGIGTSLQLERARSKHTDEAIEGVRAVLRVLIVFALVTPFHSLFDQKASTWVLQGGQMAAVEIGGFLIDPAQMQALNPALVMLLIPFNNIVLYPWLRRRGWEPTSLRRMTIGLAFAGLAWVVAGAIQLVIDGGGDIMITWQLAPYILLTLGEVLVSATGLEFAYSQAPLAMKGVIMSFWNLTTTVGNLWVLLANAGVRNKTVTSQIESTGLGETAFLMFFFAVFAFVAAIVFKLYTRRYQMTDNYRTA